MLSYEPAHLPFFARVLTIFQIVVVSVKFV
jgi:hypothetical protein